MMPGAQEYERRWLHSKQSVAVAMPDGEGGGDRSAVITGLAPSGAAAVSAALRHSDDVTSCAGFIVADMQGERVELHPDMTSMDMTRRLLYAKRL
jgi:hypothetical protein